MMNTVVLNQGMALPSRGHLAVWRHFLVVAISGGGASEEKSEMM